MTDDVNKTDVGFSCRQAVPNDWEFVQYLLLEICKLHASFRPDIFRDGGLKYDAESFAALTACPDTPVFICENSHGDRVGYIFLCLRTVVEDILRRAAKVLYIDDLCVSEPFRRSGAGSFMISFAEGYAARSGCDRVELNCWCANNRAMRFYEAVGYKPQRTIMEKKLNGEV